MEYTVQAYLRRRTTAELHAFLCFCNDEKRKQEYEHVIPDILQILQEREEAAAKRDTGK